MRCLALFLACSAALGAEAPVPPPPIGARLADWSAPRADNGKTWSATVDGREARAIVVLFMGTECPVGNIYVPTLVELNKKYAGKGVLFIGINSNQQDDPAAVAKHAKEFSINFPVLKDEGAVVADRFIAKRTPEAFVLDGTRAVRYRGRIDDQYDKGVKRPKADHRYLADAIDAVLAGKTVTTPYTAATGCFISRPRKAKATNDTREPITYTKQIARILQKNCQTCHRQGEIGPFKLTNYSDVVAWAEPIREAVMERRMPPYKADTTIGSFRNARILSDEEKSQINAWIDQGCLEGNPADLPPPREFAEGWQIGNPDEVLTFAEENQIPAQAPRTGMPYKYILCGEPFKEDRYIQAVEARPGNRGVVHHILVFVKPPPERKPRPGANKFEQLFADFDVENPDGFGQFFLGAFAPGDTPAIYPPGFAKKIRKGSQIFMELHYTPNGTAGTDRSSVGLIYAKEPPKHVVQTRAVMNERFIIPPLAANHRVESVTEFEKPATLISLAPHMHLRGKDWYFQLVMPNGDKEMLLSVPKYDFSWQMSYVFTEPKHVPKGAKLVCVAHYDNSTANPHNPDPWSFVMWGEQTWEEMFLGLVDYYYDDVK